MTALKGGAIHLSFSHENGVLNAYKRPTDRKEDNPIAEYITAETTLPPPPYLPYPRFLLKMDISHTAKLLYALLLDRCTLSQKNGWQDGEGRIYVFYPVAEIAEILDKSTMTVQNALKELDMAGLLERERAGFSAPNRLYVKLPPVLKISLPMTHEKLYISPKENGTDDVKKTLDMTQRKLYPNQTTINKLTESQTMGVSGEPPARAYGRYENIYLSETEYAGLQNDFPDRLERLIEEMSRYLAANGKSYQNYAAALRIWADNDKKGAGAGLPDYSCKEGESL